MKKISLKNETVVFTLLFLLSYSSSVFAQQDNKFFYAMGYNITLPVNNTFTNQTGYWGGHVEAEYYIDKTYSVGFNTSWNTLLKYIPTQTYELPDKTGSITTNIYNSVFNIPITLFGRYHFGQNDRMKPYVGFAMGAQNTVFAQFYSIYEDKQSTWGYVVRPELGTIITLTKNKKINLVLGADYTFATNKDKFLSVNNIQGLDFKAGIQFNMKNQ